MVGEGIPMFIKVIKHQDLNTEDLKDIISIKKQHWNYGFESQKKWIEDQFSDDDLHILATSDNGIESYVGINELWCIIDNVKYTFWGIGNVCVDKKLQGCGIGSKVIDFVNQYILLNNKSGILLCNNQLTTFYLHSNWNSIEYQAAFVAEEPFIQNIMTYNFDLHKAKTIFLEKQF